MLTHTINHDISHSMSTNEDSLQDTNANQDPRQPTSGRGGVQLHFNSNPSSSSEQQQNPRGKRNARIVALLFIAIGVGIACGPFLMSKFQQNQQGVVSSYNQNNSADATSGPGPMKDGPGSTSGGKEPESVPTFNPSSNVESTTTSTTPPDKSEIATTKTVTVSPSFTPTTNMPTSLNPTSFPTHRPSNVPTSSEPSASPSMHPTTANPSHHPTLQPTTNSPSRHPTPLPSSHPTANPTTSHPTSLPSMHPTTAKPSHPPTFTPTTSTPSRNPTAYPTTQRPTSTPSNTPTTSIPTASPTTSSPTYPPTESPTKDPNACPSPACVLNALVGWLSTASHMPTSLSPTSLQPTTSIPTSSPPSTAYPTSSSPTSLQPTTSMPTSSPPSTAYPTSSSPTSLQPTTSYPTTLNPSSLAPSSSYESSVEPTKHDIGSTSKDSSNGIHAKNDTLTTTTSSNRSKAFDSQVRITFRGISELMDGDSAKALEDTTFSFLNDQFMDMILVHEVTLSSQSVSQSSSSEPVRALRRVSSSSSSSSNSSVKSMLRTRSMADISGTSPSLIVELSVEGVITNWNDFMSGNEDIQESDDDLISTVLSQSIMSNSSEFMDRLADESDFFPSATPRTISSVVTDPASSSSSDEGKGRKVFLILGVVVAAIAMVGAFYMELKSGAKRRRRYASDDDKQEEANFGEDLVVESGSGQEAFEISSDSLHSVSTARGIDNENPPSEDDSSCQWNSVKDSINGGGAGKGNHIMQGDESMLMKEARIQSRTNSLKSVDQRCRGYDAYVKKLDDVMKHAEDEEGSRSYNKQEEVNHSSMKSTLASAVDTTTRVNSRQHRSGKKKQEVVAAESGEESSSQRSDEDSSSQRSDEDSEVESCQRSRNMKPTHRDYLPTEQKSSRMQKSKRKSHRQRYEGMEHSAYEVVLQNH